MNRFHFNIVYLAAGIFTLGCMAESDEVIADEDATAMNGLLPLIDQMQPADYQTATFALG